jgi:hypothetical protein
MAETVNQTKPKSFTVLTKFKHTMKNKTFILLLIASFAIMCFSAAHGQSKSQTGESQSDSVKCAGITTKGLQCQSKWVDHNGYCRQHNPDKVTCSQNKANGEPCKNVVNHEGDLCHMHRAKPRLADTNPKI